MNTTLYFPPINKLGNVAFRRVCNNSGADFVFTEMVRIEKILEDEEHQLKKLQIPNDMKEKTIVQIICEDTSLMERGIKKVLDICPEVFEINYNMGCPQSSLAKQECGGGIVGNSDKVEQVAKALFKVCNEFDLKPSIKIRIGLVRDDITIYENVRRIKNAGIKKIYIHGRVLRDSYSRPATYEEIGKVKEMFPEMEIIANGDVKDTVSLKKILKETNSDGVLVGRAALENPYVFNELKTGEVLLDSQGVDLNKRINMILEFLKYAKLEDISLSHAKANITYMTKSVINGNEFRYGINNCLSYDDLIHFCENYN